MIDFPLTEREKEKFSCSRVSSSEQDCWPFIGYTQKSGHGQYNIRGKTYYAHQVAYCVANGPWRDPELCVLHKCDNPACCNPSHLYLGTKLRNTRDMIERGRQSRGEKHSTLTNENVTEIKRLYKEGNKTQKEIGKMFDIVESQVSRIVNGKRWACHEYDSSGTQPAINPSATTS